MLLLMFADTDNRGSVLEGNTEELYLSTVNAMLSKEK